MSAPTPSTPLKLAGDAYVMTHEDRAWAEKASQLEFDSLTTIRGLAEKWAASLSSALGVVGLAALFEGADKFSKLAEPWKTLAQVSFTMAVVVALAAAVFAIAAAQGTAKRAFIPGGAALRSYSREAVDSALKFLALSRTLAVIAAAGVLAAGYCLWFGERAKGSATVIEVPAGSEFCPGAAGQVTVEDSKADYLIRCRD